MRTGGNIIKRAGVIIGFLTRVGVYPFIRTPAGLNSLIGRYRPIFTETRWFPRNV